MSDEVYSPFEGKGYGIVAHDPLAQFIINDILASTGTGELPILNVDGTPIEYILPTTSMDQRNLFLTALNAIYSNMLNSL